MPTFEALAANAALPAAQRADTNYLRPYKGYSAIRQRRSDAFSDYNGLQLYVNKRRATSVLRRATRCRRRSATPAASATIPEDAVQIWTSTTGRRRSTAVSAVFTT